ncbi:MAG: TonB-dependent receptor [Candidatus Palauibacterales bacterium]|nr:TonB-dependent receptor [Candidatus Palauibacterales bacterium]
MRSVTGRSLRALFLLVGFALLSAGPLLAQEGAIVGSVSDAESGEPLEGVRVEVLSAAGTMAGGTLSGSAGQFRVTDLAPGTYAVSFSVPGWEDLRETGVEVRTGQSTRLQVTLEPRGYELNPITVTTSRGVQRLLDAPASLSVVSTEQIQDEPALTTMDHVEGQAGVDVIRSGLQGGYVVVRGFNNVFSGSLLTLTDNRIARVPSLRANIQHLNPSTNLDVERVEIVRGPASALYGPNAANGVMHVITRSPIDDPGSAVALGGGLRQQDAVTGYSSSTEGAFHGEARVAERFSDQFGVKVSGQFFTADDYRYQDPAEQENANLAGQCLAQYSLQNAACQVFAPAAGELPGRERLDRIGERDFGLERWTVDAEAEWRPDDGVEATFSYGHTQAVSSIDLTGIGAAQVQDWAYDYGQVELSVDDFYAQGYLNTSNSSDTYILQTGQPIDDDSYLAVGQLQHSLSPGESQDFVYGVDLLHTNPRTNGSINGVYEDEDKFTEVGGYLQSETDLGAGWGVTLAARADYHSILDELIFSPRAALTYSPAEGHTLRATYNRAFSTPDNNNLFLDITARRIPLGGPFSYGLQAMGTSDRGFSFRRSGGRPMMKSPFAAAIGQQGVDATTYLPTTTPTLWRIARGVVAAELPPSVAQELLQVPIPTEGDVGVALRALNPTTGEFESFPGFSAVQDIPAIQEEITNTWEAGYRGLVDQRLLLSVDAYYTLIQDFIGPLRVETPNAFLSGQQVGQYLVPRLVAEGVPQATAEQIAADMARIPGGVITPEQVSSEAASLLLTYRNFGDVDVYGADLQAEYQVTDRWNLGAAVSVVNDDRFTADGVEVALNAPTFKVKSSVGYRNEDVGFNSGVDYRFQNSFPASSGVFVGDVEEHHVFDLNLGYRVPGARQMRFQLDVRNLFDNGYRSFPGAPELGRFAMARVVYEF